MSKFINLLLFSFLFTSAAFTCPGGCPATCGKTALPSNGSDTLSKYPNYDCPKFYADWYQIRHHIMTCQAVPIPFRQKENKCDKVLRNLYIGGNEAVAFCIKRNLVDKIISFNPNDRYIIPIGFKGKVIIFRKDDKKTTDIVDLYRRSAKFMVGAKKGLLIHCAKGHSRSASLCILYLMARYNVPYEDAHRYLQIIRPTIGPKPWFVKQLKEVDYFYLHT